MKCEKKGNLVNRQVTVGQEDLEQINRLTRREFSQEELYCFRVVLCDNDVDRQMERFDEETLEQLARMFVGKTGICDHQPKTANQLARIYQPQEGDAGPVCFLLWSSQGSRREQPACGRRGAAEKFGAAGGVF